MELSSLISGSAIASALVSFSAGLSPSLAFSVVFAALHHQRKSLDTTLNVIGSNLRCFSCHSAFQETISESRLAETPRLGPPALFKAMRREPPRAAGARRGMDASSAPGSLVTPLCLQNRQFKPVHRSCVHTWTNEAQLKLINIVL